MNLKILGKKAQMAIEYMLLLGFVVAIVLLFFEPTIDAVRSHADIYFSNFVRELTR